MRSTLVIDRHAGSTRRAIQRHAIVLAIATGAAAIVLVAVLSRRTVSPTRDPASGSGETARASYAIGFSAGAGLRGALSVSVDSFHAGLRDGLAGGSDTTRVMARPELFSRIRATTKRLGDAEVAEVSTRIDEMGDR